MSANQPDRQDHHLAFLRGFLNRPKEVGSIIPSSRFMERRIVKTAELASARLAVELGPGTGGTTRALLRKMAPDAILVAIELVTGASICIGVVAAWRTGTVVILVGHAVRIVVATTGDRDVVAFSVEARIDGAFVVIAAICARLAWALAA